MNVQVLDQAGIVELLAGQPAAAPTSGGGEEFRDVFDGVRQESETTVNRRKTADAETDRSTSSTPRKEDSTDEPETAPDEVAQDAQAKTVPTADDGVVEVVPLDMAPELATTVTTEVAAGPREGTPALQPVTGTATTVVAPTVEAVPTAANAGVPTANPAVANVEVASVEAPAPKAVDTATLQSVTRDSTAKVTTTPVQQAATAPTAEATATATAQASTAEVAAKAAQPRTELAEPQAQPNSPSSATPASSQELGGWFQDSADEDPRQFKGDRDARFFMLQEGAEGKAASNSAAANTGAATPAAVANAATVAPGTQGASPAEELASVRAAPPNTNSSTVTTDGSGLAPAGSTSRAHADSVARATTVVSTQDVDDAAFSRRLYRIVRKAIRDGGGEVRLRLDPPQLGRVDLEVRLQGQQVDIAFQVDDESIRETILKNIDELHRTLESYGLASDRLSVHLRSQDGNTGDFGQAQGGESAEAGVAESDDVEADEANVVAWTHLGHSIDRVG